MRLSLRIVILSFVILASTVFLTWQYWLHGPHADSLFPGCTNANVAIDPVTGQKACVYANLGGFPKYCDLDASHSDGEGLDPCLHPDIYMLTPGGSSSGSQPNAPAFRALTVTDSPPPIVTPSSSTPMPTPTLSIQPSEQVSTPIPLPISTPPPKTFSTIFTSMVQAIENFFSRIF